MNEKNQELNNLTTDDGNTQTDAIGQTAMDDEIKSPDVLSPKQKTFNILLLGIVSLFIDMSTEMVYSVMPLFLVAIGTKPAIIGLMEGVSESLAAFLRVGSGYIADKTDKKKTLTIFGYSAAILYKIGILLSSIWVGIFVAKVIDRTGKGIRTAPRDSIIAENGGKSLGKAYGLHKTFDKMGATLGVASAYLLTFLTLPYRSVFVWSILPALIGVAILFFVKQQKQSISKQTASNKLTLKNVKLGKKLWLYIATVFVFSIGNSSNAFLLLKAKDVGFSDVNVLLVYLVFNLVAMCVAIPFGKLSDRIGRKKIIVASYLIYALVYLLFPFVTTRPYMIALFALYGVYAGILPGSEKALAVELSPKNLKATTLGLQGMAQGLGLLLSSLIAGIMWDYVGSAFPFWFGGAMALIACVMLLIVLNLKDSPVPNTATSN